VRPLLLKTLVALCMGLGSADCLPAKPLLPPTKIQRDLRQALFGQSVLAEARRHLGRPYVWGGADPAHGFDCSGYVQYVMACCGVDLPKRAADQSLKGLPVEAQSLMQGDLVFFAPSSPAASMHVGIYEGDGVFLHAPGRGKKIRRARLDAPFFRYRFLGGRRFPPSSPTSVSR
jgi:cell wall-associated NlpC family hydrolase